MGFLQRWYPALLLMGLIFMLSGTPATQVGGAESAFQAFLTRWFPALSGTQINWLKVGHVVGYAWLGLAFRRGFAFSRRHPSFWAILATIIFAITDELHQSLVPGRSASFSDVLLDTAAAGMMVGMQQVVGLFRRG